MVGILCCVYKLISIPCFGCSYSCTKSGQFSFPWIEEQFYERRRISICLWERRHGYDNANKRLSVIERDIWPKKSSSRGSIKNNVANVNYFFILFRLINFVFWAIYFSFPNTRQHWDMLRFTFQKVCIQPTTIHWMHAAKTSITAFFARAKPWKHFKDNLSKKFTMNLKVWKWTIYIVYTIRACV